MRRALTAATHGRHPRPHGFLKVQTVRQTVKRPSKQWYWEANNQLVMVAQQHLGTPDKVEADQRGIPPHVLWQWVP
jgi:hypothetical protein